MGSSTAAEMMARIRAARAQAGDYELEPDDRLLIELIRLALAKATKQELIGIIESARPYGIGSVQ